MEEIKGIAAC